MRLKVLATGLFLMAFTRLYAQSNVIDSLKRIIVLDQRDSVEAKAYLRLSEELVRTNIASARNYAVQAASLSRKLNLSNQLSGAYSVLATLYTQSKGVDSARYYIGLIKKLSDETHNPVVLSNYYFTEGLFYRNTGVYKTSINFMLQALKLFKQASNKATIAGEDLNIGNNYLDLGDYRSAMAYHLDALKQFEAIGNKRGISFSYTEIAADFIKLGQFKQALPYATRSLEIKQELNDKRGLATGRIALAEIQENLAQKDKALQNYQAALAINKSLKLTIEVARTDLKIGNFYISQSNTETARSYLDSSAVLYKQLGDTAQLSVISGIKANLETKLADKAKTERTLLNTVSSSVQTGDKSTEVNNYKYLSDFYAKNKQYDKALLYYQKYHLMDDSLQSKAVQLQTADMEHRYNFEKSRQEISLLKKNKQIDEDKLREQTLFRYAALVFIVMLIVIGLLITARRRAIVKAERQLEMEKMRNNIARNLHDDIGSGLTSINVMSKVALSQADAGSEISTNLKKIQNSSYRMMEGMSDIVWAINPDNDPLEQTIIKMKEFAAGMLESAGIDLDFKYSENIADMKLGAEERKNIYLVFKEAINNIVKYSGANRVNVNVQVESGRLTMLITDDGKGFDTAVPAKGNGLKNMKSRAAEMKAFFKISSREKLGTSIRLSVAVT